MGFIYRFFRALYCFVWDGFIDRGSMKDEHRIDNQS